MFTRSLRFSFLPLALASGLGLGSANAVTITREFTASWHDPSHSGHGFSIEVIDGPLGKTLVAFWFTHDLQGKPMWLVVSGPVEGERALVILGRRHQHVAGVAHVDGLAGLFLEAGQHGQAKQRQAHANGRAELVAGAAESKPVGEKVIHFFPKSGATFPLTQGQKGIIIIQYQGKYSTFFNTDYKSFKKTT